ncbi:hypothetical protein B0T13DRAFT_118438 [Neurospora crassa]|nr:hypothetical protein B0T13DRAFT_118438 [Neurospora crassa]
MLSVTTFLKLVASRDRCELVGLMVQVQNGWKGMSWLRIGINSKTRNIRRVGQETNINSRDALQCLQCKRGRGEFSGEEGKKKGEKEGLSRRELNPGLERIELMFKLDKLTY